MNVRNLNQARAANGIVPINHVWCKICHIMDTHFWWNCPNVRFKICHQPQASIYSSVKLACQWCGSLNHSSVECNALKFCSVKQALNENASDVDNLVT